MNGMLARTLSATALLALAAAPLAGQGGLMFGGGLTFPQGHYGEQVEVGGHGMVGIDVPLSRHLGLRVDAGYHLNAIDALNPDEAANLALFAVSGNGVFHFGSGGVRPYLMGGVTWASPSCAGDECLPGLDVGYNLGGGLLGGVLFLEMRYISIGGETQVDVLPITIGFHF